MERIGACKGLPSEYRFSDLRIERLGYFSIASYAVEGLRHRMEAVIRTGAEGPYLSASFILPVDFANRETYLIRAPRHNRFFVRTDGGAAAIGKALQIGFDPAVYGIPGAALDVWDTAAGMVEPNGETARDAAAREAKEELGIEIDPARLVRVASLNGSIGVLAENLELYLCALDGRTLAVAPEGDGDERLEVWRMSFEEAFRLLDDGQIPNAGGRALVAHLKDLDQRRRITELETRLAVLEGAARRTQPHGK